MAINPYFSQAVRSEQSLYEDIIIESLKIYGQDVYYLPRDIVSEDTIFGDDVTSRFNSSYKIEMYIENTEGFEGEGDLFTKFGIEIRDQATFVVARRRWDQTVKRYDNEITTARPAEGDLIYLPLSKSLFQIMAVEHEQPFYQLSNLPTYKLRCELFEFTGENLDTGIKDIDDIQVLGYNQILTLVDSDTNLPFVGKTATQTLSSGVVLTAEIASYVDSADQVTLVNISANAPGLHKFGAGSITLTDSANNTFVRTVSTMVEDLNSNTYQNDAFDIDFIDFTETNPFGDPR
jgi:hypothetical protein